MVLLILSPRSAQSIIIAGPCVQPAVGNYTARRRVEPIYTMCDLYLRLAYVDSIPLGLQHERCLVYTVMQYNERCRAVTCGAVRV